MKFGTELESLDLREEDRLHFVSEKVNKRSNLGGGGFSKRDFEIIIIIFFFLINGCYWF